MRVKQQYLQLTKTFCFSFFRDKLTVFFVIGLPLLFMFIFGFLFADDFTEGQQNSLALYAGETDNSSQVQLLQEKITNNEGLEYIEVNSREQGKEMVRSLEADMFLEVAADGTLQFFLNPARLQDNQQLEQSARALVAELDTSQAGLSEFFTVNTEEVGSTEGSELEFMFPGLIAMGLASAGLFALLEAFMHYREKGVLKRMLASPMNRNIFLLSLMSSRLPGAVISSLLVLLGGRFLFGLTFSINWWLFIIYLIIGTIIMMGMGALISLFTNKAESALQVASILFTVMIFFSGIYFPMEFLPAYLQKVGVLLPLTYVARGMRYTMGVEYMAFSSFLLESVGLFLISFLIIFVVAHKSAWIE